MFSLSLENIFFLINKWYYKLLPDLTTQDLDMWIVLHYFSQVLAHVNPGVVLPI